MEHTYWKKTRDKYSGGNHTSWELVEAGTNHVLVVANSSTSGINIWWTAISDSRFQTTNAEKIVDHNVDLALENIKCSFLEQIAKQ
jgi:hypothetical protein